MLFRSCRMTPEQLARTQPGQQAYQIRAWVYEDPAARADEGLQRIDALARSTEDPAALNEIIDVGTMLSRLADSRPPARTISSQVRSPGR